MFKPSDGDAMSSGVRAALLLLAGGLMVVAAAPAARAQKGDTAGPKVVLGLPEGARRLTTTEELFFLDGKVSDPGGVSRVVIDGEKVPLVAGGDGGFVFNHFVSLKLGANAVNVVAADRANNRTRVTVRIERRKPEAFHCGARYRLALMPLKQVGAGKAPVHPAYGAIVDALFAEPVRFSLVERDPAAVESVILEHKLRALADVPRAAKVGKLLSAEGVLFGTIQQVGSATAIGLRLVDTETSEVLVATRVCVASGDGTFLRLCARGLVAKLKRSFPLVRAEVIGLDGETIRIDAGKDRGLRRGMKLLLYREKKIGSRLLRRAIKRDGSAVVARVTAVEARRSSAKLPDADAAALVRAGDKAITK